MEGFFKKKETGAHTVKREEINPEEEDSPPSYIRELGKANIVRGLYML